jgi:flagellar hook-associated protein 3 FlgL
MTLSISTYGLFNLVLGSAKTVQKAEAQASMQESTGLVGSSFEDYGSKSRQLLSLENESTQTQTWNDNTSVASDRSQATYSAIGDMITQLTSLKTAISSAMSGTSAATLNSTGQDALQDIAGSANTQLDGRYLFAGGQSDQPAVDLTTYQTTTASAGTADTSYYQGDSQLGSVRISDSSTVTYGVTGDESGIEEALRTAKLVSQASTDPVDSTALGSIFDLATKAITDLSNMQANVSVTSGRLQNAQQSQTSYLSLLSDATSSIKNVDSAQALANVKQLDTQLQASYSALSIVMQTHLTSYL